MFPDTLHPPTSGSSFLPQADDSLFEQAPEEAPVAQETGSGVTSPPKAAPAASRFAYDTLTEGDDTTPHAPRGKDGHLTIGGGGGDFFSNPNGSATTSGRKKEMPKTQVGTLRYRR